MNETRFIQLYTEITECSEDRARSVYIVLSDDTTNRVNLLFTPQHPAPRRPQPTTPTHAHLSVEIGHLNPLPALRPSL